MAIVEGSGSVTVAGEAGHAHLVGTVRGWFDSAGASGTLQLKDGSAVVWSAAVSGAFEFCFPGGWEFAAGHALTLALSGGYVWLTYVTDQGDHWS